MNEMIEEKEIDVQNIRPSKINEYIVWALLFSDEVKNKTSFNNYKCVLNSEINDRLK